MGDYSQSTDFSSKDALTTGDPEKAISGADVDGELSLISDAIASKLNAPTSPSNDDLIVWSGSAWAGKNLGVDGTAGQAYTTDGTTASWGSVVSHTYDSDISGGTTKDFTSIPSWVRAIEISVSSGSLSAAGGVEMLLGDSGGFEATGYTGGQHSTADGSDTQTTYFPILSIANNTNTFDGVIRLRMMDSATNRWFADWTFSRQGGDRGYMGAGAKALSGALTQIRLRTSAAETFDAGNAAITYW